MKNNLPRVSIVVPIFNSITHVEAFFKSLIGTAYSNYEIIAVDDNSTDGTKEYLQKISSKNKKITVVETLRRIGLTKSRNLGIEIAKGEYIAFAEVDMLFEKNWLMEAIKVLDRDKSLGGVCGKVLDVRSKSIINAVGIMTIPNIGWVVSRGIGEKDKGQYNTPIECNMGSVGSIVRTSVMRGLNGFDEELDRIDDTDFGWRIWLLGYKILAVPSSVTYHVVVKKWDLRRKNVTRIQQEMAFGRVLRILTKNYEMKSMFLYVPQAFAILLARSIINLTRGNVYSLIGFIFSIIWYIKTFPSTLKERNYIQARRKVSDEFIFKKIMVTNNLYIIYKRYAQDVYKRILRVPAIG